MVKPQQSTVNCFSNSGGARVHPDWGSAFFNGGVEASKAPRGCGVWGWGDCLGSVVSFPSGSILSVVFVWFVW